MKTLFNKLTALVGTLALVIAMTACPKSQKDKAVAFARDLVASLQAATPIVAQKSEALANQLRQATQNAALLIDAINASNQTEIVRLVRDILPVFTTVVQAFTDNQNVLIALALAQIALNFFVNHYLQAGGIAAQAADNTVSRFQALPQFGCQFKPERCK